MTKETLIKTPLYEFHKELNAKFIEFANFYMPVEYEGIIKEHNYVRNDFAIFDVSHMGEFLLEGKDAYKFANYLITNNIEKIKDNQVLYTVMCNEKGGVVDDLLVYRFKDNKVMLVVNAANIQKDKQWILSHINNFDVSFKDISMQTSLIAIQGPKSELFLSKFVNIDLTKLLYYHFVETSIFGKEVILSRTGYTGEDGFEVYTDNEHIKVILSEFLKHSVKLAGLGARDTLRLEASYPLYGNELTDDISPLHANLSWTVKLKSKGDFLGKSALLDVKNKGLSYKLYGLVLKTKAIARHLYKVFSKDEKEIGYISSGSFSPTLKVPIAMAYLPVEYKIGDFVLVKVRKKFVDAEIVKLPFYKGSVKR